MKRLPMRMIRGVLRLRVDGFSGDQVAQSLSLGRATVSDYFRRAEVAGLGWPLPYDLSDCDIERLLFPRSATTSARRPAMVACCKTSAPRSATTVSVNR